AANARLVEPGPIGRFEILYEIRLAFAHDQRVLAGDLARVDDQIAVLAPSDDKAILDHLALGAVLPHENELRRSGGRLLSAARPHLGGALVLDRFGEHGIGELQRGGAFARLPLA